jgi:hypothetical protein
MNKMLATLILLALTAALPTQAREAEANAEGHAVSARVAGRAGPLIYLVPGVVNRVPAQQPTATSFHCTNFGSTVARIQLVIQDPNHVAKANKRFSLAGGHATTVSTQDTTVYVDDIDLNILSNVTQGVARIFSSTREVACSAQVLDAYNDPPIFAVALHMVRFRPVRGTQE